jgi:phage gpG-like protein
VTTDSGIQFEAHVTATSDALKELAQQLGDRRVPNRQLAVQMSSWVARNFAAEGRLNVPWASLAVSTAARRVTRSGARRGFEHILVQSGLLRASFQQFAADNDTATVGSAISYAVYHEEGGEHLPRRPMLPTPEIALDMAVDVYENYIERHQRAVGL